MTDDQHISEPELGGSSLPVPVQPSIALAAPAALQPRRSDDDLIAARDLFARVVRSTFDALDNVGDSIATAIGLR
jgi:hypothetical protein